MSGLKIVRYVAWIGVILAGLGLAYVLLAPIIKKTFFIISTLHKSCLTIMQANSISKISR